LSTIIFLIISCHTIGVFGAHSSPDDGSGLRVGTKPTGLATDSAGTKLYVAYEFSNKVSVIDIGTGRQMKTIPIERFPHTMASDPDINRIYVTNGESKSISVIDGDSDEIIDTIRLYGKPEDVSVDPIEHKAYVAVENNVSAIDIYSNGIVDNTTLSFGPGAIEFNPFSQTLFATNPVTDVTSIIDGETGDIIQDITSGDGPHDVALNPLTNLIFVTHDLSDTIAVIDGNTNKIFSNISIPAFTSAISMNPMTNKLYFAIRESGMVGIINGTSNVLKDFVKVGNDPMALAVDHDKIYVANSDSNTISILDGHTDRLLLGLNFYLNPSDEGNIYCDNLQSISDDSQPQWQKMSLNYSLHPAGTEYQCKAEPKTQTELVNGFGIFGNILWELHKGIIGGYTFSSWSGDIPPDLISSAVVKFNASKFGAILTANFENTPPLFPAEYRNILVALAIPAAAGWIYKKREWFFRRKRRESLERYMKIIGAVNHTYSLNKDQDEYKSRLKNLRLEITDLYGKGALKESDYINLNNKIFEYERQIH
jgi:YVTN family beta-propeller protein